MKSYDERLRGVRVGQMHEKLRLAEAERRLKEEARGRWFQQFQKKNKMPRGRIVNVLPEDDDPVFAALGESIPVVDVVRVIMSFFEIPITWFGNFEPLARWRLQQVANIFSQASTKAPPLHAYATASNWPGYELEMKWADRKVRWRMSRTGHVQRLKTIKTPSRRN